MKNILNWLNPNIKMKRWLIAIFIGAIIFGFAISNLIIYGEVKLSTIIVTAILFIIGGTLIVISYVLAQSKLLQLITGINVMNETDNDKIQKMFRDKNIYDDNPKITIIGTGNQINSIIESVKKYSNNIDVILPFYENDIKNAIIHLSTQKDIMDKLFNDNYMFSQIEIFKNTYGDYEKGLNNLCSIFSMCGNVIPLTFDNIDFDITLSDGIELKSTDEFQKINIERGTSISNVKLKSNYSLTKTAIESIKTSDIIILAPCNLYSELIPILLVDDLYKLLEKSKAKKIYFNNIMTISGETTFYDIFDHIKAIRDITTSEFIDYVICDKGNINYKRLVKDYDNNTSEPVKYDKTKFDKEDKIKIIKKDLSTINESNEIIYDSNKSSDVIASIIANEIKK